MSTSSHIMLDPAKQLYSCQGDWNLHNLARIQKELNKIHVPLTGGLQVDGRDIAKIDSAGALLLDEFLRRLKDNGLEVTTQNFSEKCQHLLEIVDKNAVSPAKIPRRHFPNWLAQIGKFNWGQWIEFKTYLNFVGVLAYEFLRLLFRPKHWRWNSLTNVIDTTGYKALPIIGLLSFMIGVVIAYQMGNYLRSYGANIYIVNLLGLSILREFGPLITAIMVAGRTGSAFTAELGIMKINQELDALSTMGVPPGGILLLPRIMGLFITLPLLTVWADIFGVIGGMVMAKSMLDISYYDFLHRFQHDIPLRTLIIGIGKAPIFALIIASIGCFQGMQVKGSAESVGKLTTRSVVLAIFFIIVADALFSVIFSRLNL